MKENFLWNAGTAHSSMRLLIEGALVLFENDALPLTRLAHEHQEWMAAEALDTIGEALYRLRDLVRQQQEAYAAEVLRQTESGALTTEASDE